MLTCKGPRQTERELLCKDTEPSMGSEVKSMYKLRTAFSQNSHLMALDKKVLNVSGVSATRYQGFDPQKV